MPAYFNGLDNVYWGGLVDNTDNTNYDMNYSAIKTVIKEIYTNFGTISQINLTKYSHGYHMIYPINGKSYETPASGFNTGFSIRDPEGKSYRIKFYHRVDEDTLIKSSAILSDCHTCKCSSRPTFFPRPTAAPNGSGGVAADANVCTCALL